MSKISTIIDNLVTFLGTTYPAPSQEHVNPYALELNDEFGLADGWSFFIGPVQNTNEMASCQLSVERDIVINRTLKCYASKEDVAIRRAVEKQLMEDQYNILRLVENEPLIQGTIALITFVGDNGIELIQGDGEVAFLALRTTFTIRYYEQL
jgi:hypothetical protein